MIEKQGGQTMTLNFEKLLEENKFISQQDELVCRLEPLEESDRVA